MVDETLDRLYREGRGELNRAINSGFRALGREIMTAMQALHRVQWNAPWAPRSSAKCN